MPGISPKLPLSINRPEITYVTNKNLKQAIQQNIKNLILTNPGEKVFDAAFGVGLRRFLFENADSNTSARVAEAITVQVDNYMPFVEINNIDVSIDADNNKLYVLFEYFVPSLSVKDTLSLQISRF